MCMCVLESEREREREKEGGKERERLFDVEFQSPRPLIGRADALSKNEGTSQFLSSKFISNYRYFTFNMYSKIP